jgi:N-acetylglutamate synthase-like GNAT family acetyltransferase
MWEEGASIGCGTLKGLGGVRGEFKSMPTRAYWRGRGPGRRLLEHILRRARTRSHTNLWARDRLKACAPASPVPL